MEGSEFYNRLIKSWLQDNDIEIYSKHNGGNFAVAERFIRVLKNKIYKYMTSVSKTTYIYKSDDIVNEDNNSCLRKSKGKHVDVKPNTYIDIGVENNEKDPKFEAGDHVTISKYKNIFAKDYTPN